MRNAAIAAIVAAVVSVSVSDAAHAAVIASFNAGTATASVSSTYFTSSTATLTATANLSASNAGYTSAVFSSGASVDTTQYLNFALPALKAGYALQYTGASGTLDTGNKSIRAAQVAIPGLANQTSTFTNNQTVAYGASGLSGGTLQTAATNVRFYGYNRETTGNANQQTATVNSMTIEGNVLGNGALFGLTSAPAVTAGSKYFVNTNIGTVGLANTGSASGTYALSVGAGFALTGTGGTVASSGTGSVALKASGTAGAYGSTTVTLSNAGANASTLVDANDAAALGSVTVYNHGDASFSNAVDSNSTTIALGVLDAGDTANGSATFYNWLAGTYAGNIDLTGIAGLGSGLSATPTTIADIGAGAQGVAFTLDTTGMSAGAFTRTVTLSFADSAGITGGGTLSDLTVNLTGTVVVPEPSSLIGIMSGLALVSIRRRRSK